ncbi:short-chain collagen C4-like [Amphiura filiformis]|uniref:short-chain collagen C4-like n=1 Tax=Amphiura filiformis TaxID=82378 RepID=UPI003B2114FC
MTDTLSDGSSNPHVDVGQTTPGSVTTQVTETLQQTTCPPVDCPDGESSPQPTQTPPTQASSGSAVYIRWGRTVCPVTASLVYKGVAGGKWYSQTGGGSNYLCLPDTPEYDDYRAGVDDNRAFVYSSEYQYNSFPPLADSMNHDAPCAVCLANNRISLMIIPAKMTCPATWTREYHGYLMASKESHQTSEFVCVDRNPEARPDSAADKNGANLYLVEGRCTTGNLPCSPYIDGAELTCVVCTQ